ncbi:MAG: tetraacyldisaccharide 4'-kinase [Candidatus Omnitrophica bacterium]|nr:tetraacyldisaccharide 4'-kinase [Candidatus Omnitrophota bacterium]
MREYLYKIATDKIQGFIPGLIKAAFFFLSIIYGLSVRGAIFFSRIFPCRLGCKVISVGNITVGGTGKTTLVEYIARYLKDSGHKVAILSRGYKRKSTSSENMGDEPYMLSKNLSDIPVIVNKDRASGALRAIIEYQTDTVILDDGMQQWRLRKDLEIIAIDAVSPFGNRHLLPRGILREPLSGLKRADIFILTKSDLAQNNIEEIKGLLGRVNPRAKIFESIHQPLGFYQIGGKEELFSPRAFTGKPAVIFCAIGDPDSFEKTIKNLGIEVALSFNFPDHHHYGQKDLERITKVAQARNIDLIITTQKDAARLDRQLQARILVLRIGIKITKDEDKFRDRLLKLYSL